MQGPLLQTPAGLLEVTAGRFDELTRTLPAEAVYSIDLKLLLPGDFREPRAMPKLLARIWRQAADELLAAGRGFYTDRGNGTIDVFAGTAKDVLGPAIAVALDLKIRHLLAEPTENLPSHASPASPDSAAARPVSDLEQLIRHGLGERPSPGMLHVWSARVLQELIHSREKVPLPRDILELVARTKLAYHPFWYAETGMIEGSRALPDACVPGQPADAGLVTRNDLGALFSAAVQILYLEAQGERGIVIVPFHAATLADGPAVDLCRCYLHRLPATVAASLMLEVKGLGRSNIPAATADAIRSLSDGMRGFIFSTDIGNSIDYRQAFPVLHGQSIDLADYQGDGRTLPGAVRGYARRCRRAGLKSLAAGVSDSRVAVAARQAGYTYICGPVVGPVRRAAIPRHRLGLPAEE